MLQVSLARLKQGHRTIAYPAQEPTLPDRFRGLPAIDASKCPDGCQTCIEACPTDALAATATGLSLDLGRCPFCTACPILENAQLSWSRMMKRRALLRAA